ncbi:hypothetical protein Pint_16103 [Pistacia integerrima]|uniref:Uncharacterized protein n=1 Tax=Pistacia integerrima TaxID=434235 RepID=A0ACC0ZAE5_9ROSI|nr:hypothetical protein Pint_16103 [Pistacia integerrima]
MTLKLQMIEKGVQVIAIASCNAQNKPALLLDVYIYDYLMKRKLHASAKAFQAEGKVSTDPVGSVHYPRMPPEMWCDIINKAKDGGLNVIQTYVFWSSHEPVQGQYNFEGNCNLTEAKKPYSAGLLEGKTMDTMVMNPIMEIETQIAWSRFLETLSSQLAQEHIPLILLK